MPQKLYVPNKQSTAIKAEMIQISHKAQYTFDKNFSVLLAIALQTPPPPSPLSPQQ